MSAGRRRWIHRGSEARVWCPSGRWGPRRTRVTECVAVLQAEDVYTALLTENAAAVGPGAAGTATYILGGAGRTVWWEVRHNAVWRRGRVFLRCPDCARRATRLYQPVADCGLACRRCWGLTYPSQTLHNYKGSLWGRGIFAQMFRTTQRDWALQISDDRRRMRRSAAQKRWTERRPYLEGWKKADANQENEKYRR